jgi:hypothetical protein
METSCELFVLDMMKIQPSQLFVSSSKLDRIFRKFDHITTNAITPVHVLELDGQLIYTDGHTRALALFLRGETKIRAYWDTDELDLDAYRKCVQWCRDEDIRTIVDLKDRILMPDDYQVKWLKRCRDMHRLLRENRKTD